MGCPALSCYLVTLRPSPPHHLFFGLLSCCSAPHPHCSHPILFYLLCYPLSSVSKINIWSCYSPFLMAPHRLQNEVLPSSVSLSQGFPICKMEMVLVASWGHFEKYMRWCEWCEHVAGHVEIPNSGRRRWWWWREEEGLVFTVTIVEESLYDLDPNLLF